MLYVHISTGMYVVRDEVAVQARVKNCNVMAALSFRLQFKRNINLETFIYPVDKSK